MIVVLMSLAIVAGTILYCELSNKDSRTNNWLWCRKHGLRLKERVGPECSTLWSGVDAFGNEYVPDADGEPRMIIQGYNTP